MTPIPVCTCTLQSEFIILAEFWVNKAFIFFIVLFKTIKNYLPKSKLICVINRRLQRDGG